MTCRQRRISLPGDESLFAGPPTCSHACRLVPVRATLSHTCRTQALHRTHVSHSLDHKVDRQQMQIVRFNSHSPNRTQMQMQMSISPFNCGRCATHCWSFNPDFSRCWSSRKRSNLPMKSCPKSGNVCPTLDNESPTARCSKGAESSNLKIRDSSVRGGGPYGPAMFT